MGRQRQCGQGFRFNYGCGVQALADAIRRVTDMNPDLSVEKIEIQTSSSEAK